MSAKTHRPDFKLTCWNYILGFVGELQKRIAHMKAEKERSDKITKYYEGNLA